MSSPRLLAGVAVAALASAALPATAAATLKRVSPFPEPAVSANYGTYTDSDGNLQQQWTSDGILAPGDTVDTDFPVIDDVGDNSAPYDGTASAQLFESGSSYLSMSNPAGGSPTIRNFTGGGGAFQNTTAAGAADPYRLQVSNSLVCGTNVPLRLSFPTLGPLDMTYGLPTGAPAAYHSVASDDIGNIVGDGGTKDSVVKVTDNGLLKGLRIHIDELDHHYSTHWLKIKLVSPSGRTATLFNQTGATDNGAQAGNKHLTNVTFSETPVNGVAPEDASVAAGEDFTGSVIRPVDSFSVFDGDQTQGTWHLVISDVKVPLEARSLRGRSANFSADQMFQVGGWEIQEAGATCNPKPQAWVDTPLIVDPAGGPVDASGSYSPVPGRSITKYEWDTNTSNDTPAVTYETTTTTPILSYPATAAGTKVLRLRVTDNTGAVSDILDRNVIITKKPVFDDNVPAPAPAPTAGNHISVSPATPQAGDTVNLVAHATDAETASNLLTYAWDLNDDGVFDDSTSAATTIKWDTSGSHIIRVKVTDQQGASTLYYQTITVANQPPVANFTFGPNPAVVGQPVTFDASGSTDSDGTVVSYGFDMDGDNLYEDHQASAIYTHTFNQAGDYFVQVEAIDNTGGEDHKTATIHVTGAPVAVITASSASPLVGESVSFSASGSHDSDPSGSIAKYEWDLDGNGSWDVTGSTATTAARAYPNAGSVNVRLRVTDNDGATNVSSLSIVIRNPSSQSGNVTPTPKATPTPTPKPGGGNGQTPGGGTNPVVPGLNTDLPVDNANDPKNLLGATPPNSEAQSENGFIVKLSAGAKQHAKKTYKKGILVAYTANSPGTVTVNLMVLPKDAKKVGLKLKGTKLVKIGAGKAVLKKAGAVKFYVVVAKKYQKYVKKATKMPVSLRALGTSKDKEQLAIAKAFTYVK